MEVVKSSSNLQLTRRRYRRRSISIAIIRSIFREICSCLSGIFVLKLNVIHTTKTSLNPTNIVLVTSPQPRQRQQVQINELAAEEASKPLYSNEQWQISEPLTKVNEQLRTSKNLIQSMLDEKYNVLEYIQNGFKSLTERITPILSRLSLLTMAFCVVWHKTLTQLIVYPIFRLLFGTLYPAYASYKAVKTKNVREYVKWMMYWIVFALFTCAETFTDVFLSWFPFYYEIKIILVIWLLSPATKGSSILYRKFVHPMLSSREQEIDEYISKAKEQSYKQVLDLGSKGVNALMQTALKGGGGLVNQIRKSYSLSDLSEQRHERDYDGNEETDSLGEPRVVRRRHSPRRHSPRRHTTTSAIYFSEIDVRHDVIANIQSVDEISSGYSSGEIVHPGQPAKIQAREGLVRTGSIGSSKLKPTRVTRSTVPKKTTEDHEYYLESLIDSKENIIYLNDKAQFLYNLDNDEQKTRLCESTSSEEEFRDCVEHDGNVDFSPSNTLNISQTVDVESKDMMHENLENSVQLCKTTSLKDSEIKKEYLQVSNSDHAKVKSDLEICTDYKNRELKKDPEETKANDNSIILAGDINIKRDNRGGKYNKHTAPLPPCRQNTADIDISAIKATLVLKPGVVKSIGLDKSKSEIFCHSPKLKRRSLNISISESLTSTTNTSQLSDSPSDSKSKLDLSLSRLKMLQKKIGFWHKDDSAVGQKKKSVWYDNLAVPNKSSKELSKSDDEISKLHAKEKLLNKIKLFQEEQDNLENNQ